MKVGLRLSYLQSANQHQRRQPVPGELRVHYSDASLLCGQSRSTIRARHFAALIGRLWIGGY